MVEPRDLQIASASRSIPSPVTNGGGSGGFLVAERLGSRRNAALTAMIATDREGLVTQFDSGAEQLIQASAASILGRALVDVFQIADEDRAWFFGGESNSEDAKHKRFPCRVCDAAGQARYASWSRLALQDASGNVESIVFTAICQPHSRPESPAATPWCFLEDGDQAMAIADSSGTILSANRSLIDLWGFRYESEIVGQRFTRLFKRGNTDDDLNLQRAQSELTSGRHTAITRDGSEFFVETAMFGIKTADNELSFILLFKDLKEVIQYEQEIRAYTERLQAILNSSPECVKIVDKDCRLLEMNSAGLVIVEAASFKDIENANVLEIVEPESHAIFLKGLSDACAGRQTLIEFGIIGLNGTHRWMEQHAVGVKGLKEDPEEMCMLAVTRDVTEQQKAQKQLVALRDKLAHFARLGTLGELASGLSHELNQPLAALELYANAALEMNEEQQSEMRADCLRRVSQQALLAGEIVKRMRSFVKGSPPRPERVQLNSLVTEVIKICETDLKSNGVSIKTDLSWDLPEMEVDKIQIQQVLINLIRNAIEAMGSQPAESRLIQVETTLHQARICLRVKDTGEGIGPEVSDKLFMPFQTSKADGLGLGLAISQNVIESHGGRIRALSNLDVGATFEVELPLRVGRQGERDAEARP